MKRMMTTVAAALIAIVTSGYAQSGAVPAGTTVDIRTNETIDVKNAGDGRIFSGSVDKDVLDASGRVAIPRGSSAELMVRKISNSEMAVDLESVQVGGQRYVVGSDVSNQSATQKDGLGTNQRTGKYVGGGALIGTIVGAIAGGGKGAAIGAATGAAAGAGVQVLTRGKSVKVPAESVVSFQLNSPLQVTTATQNGYTRRGKRLYKR